MRNVTKFAGLGLGALLFFSVSEAGAMTTGTAPTHQPAAVERAAGTLEIAARKSTKARGARTSAQDRRDRTRARNASPRTRRKSR